MKGDGRSERYGGSSVVRREVLGLLATPVAPAGSTARLGGRESVDHLGPLRWWLRQVLGLSPAIRTGPLTLVPPNQLRLTMLSPYCAKVCLLLVSEEDLLESARTLPHDAITKRPEDLVVLILCADATKGSARDAVETVLHKSIGMQSDRLLIVEPCWSAGILVERYMPLMAGDRNLVSRMPAAVSFEG